MRKYNLRCLAAGFAALVTLGCTSPNSQLTSCQQDKEKLLTTIRQQREAGRALQQKVASLETRLGQAETELAVRPGDTRISSRPLDPPLAKKETLPWRAPAANSDILPVPESRKSSNVRKAASGSLAKLAERDQRLTYDSASSAARLNVPLAFDREGAALTAEDKEALDEVARLLKSDSARDLRVMVTGHGGGRPSTTTPKAEGEARFTSARQLGAARAQSVADYLDRHGIAQDRLGVSGVGSGASLAEAGKSDSSGGVQIYLLEPDAPVVGWAPSPTLRR